MSFQLTRHARLHHTQNYLHIVFDRPHQILSSAVCNGGLVWADQMLNLKVPAYTDTAGSPVKTLIDYADSLGGKGRLTGMMTAASMNSFRMAVRSEQDVDIVVLATAGLSNARRAGDRAEYRLMTSEPEETGTINLIVLTSACLTPAAMTEALMIVTEAKAAVLQDADVRSAISGLIATGTGTDAVAIVNGAGPDNVSYCGKHVLFGEHLAQAVIEAVTGAIDREVSRPERD
ncbi:adenosylcobinamide amidohydrolase [Oceanospirillum sediminis]|uniref:Adenosylcobinamide amidohydrolase n=1 Tax=Oceanospirillum sediminis TaxID=2760088 RepID=A0A839ITR2_9GAMM|nr:adenosylcobinamide amidohydrolase [Oceanospirillum sediminis]MBB1488843.1 adenosylcobinamide amidohydrolase [Oceanospirillum sediminis]